MCPQSIGIKDHSLGNTDEGTNNFFDGEDSDIRAVGLATNNNVVYTLIDSNKSARHRYQDNTVYNDLMKQVTNLCTTV